MSNDAVSDDGGNGLPSVDNLTPFEYALAGVSVPEAQDSPSLAVIESLRELADEVGDAPVAHPGLSEFLRSGGSIARRNDRRSMRRRRPATGAEAAALAGPEGGFIDITPIELTSPPEPATTAAADPGPALAPDAEQDATVTSDVPAGSALVPGADHDEPSDASPADVADLEDPPEAEAGEQLVLAEMAVLEPSADTPSVPLADGASVSLDGDPGTEESPAPMLFGPTEPAAESAPEPPVGSTADAAGSDDRAVFVAAGPDQGSGGRGVLADSDVDSESDSDSEDARVGAAAVPMAAAVAVVPLPARRLGGTFWALTATAAAAAVLAVGALWWANGLDQDATATDGALVSDGDQSGEGDDGAGSGGPSGGDGGDDGTSVGASSDADDGAGTETGEFGSDGSSAAAQRSTTDPLEVTSTTARRTSSSGGSTTSAGDATTTVTDPTASTSESTTTTELSTTRPTTTEPPETTRRTTTRPPTTQPPTTTPPLAFIGDSVNIGSYNGPGARDVLVALYDDPDRDGTPDTLNQSRRTSANGRYTFNVPGACYVLRFFPPEGFRVEDGHEIQTVCVAPGEASARMDAIVHALAKPDGPSRCTVEPPGNESWRGVEVIENNSDWAASYTFYGDRGQVIVRTRDLGPPDDIEGSKNREWHAKSNGFDHRDVYSVAAEREGLESDPVGCRRESDDDD